MARKLSGHSWTWALATAGGTGHGWAVKACRDGTKKEDQGSGPWKPGGAGSRCHMLLRRDGRTVKPGPRVLTPEGGERGGVGPEVGEKVGTRKGSRTGGW